MGIKTFYGKFKIDDLLNILDSQANDNFNWTFDYTTIEDADHDKMVHIFISYREVDDYYVISWKDIYGVTHDELSLLDFIDRFRLGGQGPAKMEGIARIVYRYNDESDARYFDYVTTYNDTVLFLFRLNSERNKVNKSLIYVDNLTGAFKAGVNIKNPIINIENFKIDNTFNYVYINSLHRYYYVNNIELTTKNITSLLLAEDVLMSFKDLILLQSAFIERSQSDGNDDKEDSLYTFDKEIDITYDTVTPTKDVFNLDPLDVNRIILTVVRGL